MKYGISYIFKQLHLMLSWFLLLECLQQSNRQYELKPIWVSQNHELTFFT